MEDEKRIIPASNLPEGWAWHLYDDGSGGLYSPENKCIVNVDFATSEYRYEGEWNFIPGYPKETVSPKVFMEDMEKYIRSNLEREGNLIKNQTSEEKGSLIDNLAKNKEIIKEKEIQQKGEKAQEVSKQKRDNEDR